MAGEAGTRGRRGPEQHAVVGFGKCTLSSAIVVSLNMSDDATERNMSRVFYEALEAKPQKADEQTSVRPVVLSKLVRWNEAGDVEMQEANKVDKSNAITVSAAIGAKLAAPWFSCRPPPNGAAHERATCAIHEAGPIRSDSCWAAPGLPLQLPGPRAAPPAGPHARKS